ncbi:MAG TPA: sulfotransferase [Tepidisphaeraceae bacterium]|nr:sulfotransferase [Tepidisphaeraceae bacterium]
MTTKPGEPFSQAPQTVPAPKVSPMAMAEEAARAGDALHSRGRFAEARARFAAAIELVPQRADYHLRFAVAAWAQGDRPAVEPHLREAVRLAPQWATAHEALSQLLLEDGRVDAAIQSIEQAASLAPNDFSIMTSRAFVLEQSGRHQLAWEIVLRAITAGQENVRLAMLYARMSANYGHDRQALAVVRRVLAARRGTPRDAASLHSCASALLDRQGLYDEAFAHARQANDLRGVSIDLRSHEQFADRQIQYFTRRKIRGLPKSMLDSSRIVLVVGMPRSGTSLIEQVLASHPAVHGAGELFHLNHLANRAAIFLSTLTPPGTQDFPASLERLTLNKADELAASYLQPVLALNPSAARIVDKMPLNLHVLGLAALLLPQARVIFCRRDPMDTCLSCYLTEFAFGHEYSYDLANTGRYHQLCDRLIAHWQANLDLPMLDVRYEDMVADSETQSRRLIEFIGLPWDDRCLRFHETARPVATASAQQVRRPIYSSSVGRWKNYEKHLAPLREALGQPATSPIHESPVIR